MGQVADLPHEVMRAEKRDGDHPVPQSAVQDQIRIRPANNVRDFRLSSRSLSAVAKDDELNRARILKSGERLDIGTDRANRRVGFDTVEIFLGCR